VVGGEGGGGVGRVVQEIFHGCKNG
jgi:hypothetical protein